MSQTPAPSVEFFFDTASPYSYLASTQVGGLSDRTGATIEWRPFFLGGLFQSIGNATPATLAPRGRYMARDLRRWAKRYGVPFNWPSRFPMNTIGAQRLLLAVQDDHGEEACGRLTAALFTAYWVDDRDLKDGEVLRDVAAGAGFDAEALLARTQEPAIKERLKGVTQEAEDRGVFGAPTFFFGEEMYFGNDRLLLLEDALMESR